MDLINTTDKINWYIDQLEKAKGELDDRAKEVAKTKSHYEKMIEITQLELKAGREMEANGETVKWTSVTNSKEIAKGLCEKESYDMILAELRYKNLFKGIEILISQMSGAKSILPHQQQF